EEGRHIVALDGEVAEPPLPLAVPVGAARHEQPCVGGHARNALGIGVSETWPIALDAVEAVCDESGKQRLERVRSRMSPHRDAAGRVDDVDGLEWRDERGGDERRTLIPDVS